MGVERVIRFAADVPTWSAVAAKLSEVGETPALRMIDGLPAFPDEVPEATWQELRIGLAGGMVTLRRSGTEVRIVTWGATDLGLTRSWDLLCWAVAAAGSGLVVTPDGSRDADAFRADVLGAG